jgi:hypothetical protein
MAGIAPAVIFPMVRDLKVKSEAFVAYTGEHWTIVAGKPAHRIFAVVDGVQLACAGLVILSFIGLVIGGQVKRSGRTLVWTLGLAAGTSLLAYELFILAPRMDLNIHQFWDAAVRGDTVTATTHQAAFDADHPVAARVYGGLFCVVLVTALTAGWPGKDKE